MKYYINDQFVFPDKIALCFISPFGYKSYQVIIEYVYGYKQILVFESKEKAEKAHDIIMNAAKTTDCYIPSL